MKILWIVNEFFPSVSEKLNLPISLYGGWTFGLAERLKTIKEIELYVITVDQYHHLDHYENDGINYFVLKSSHPKIKYDKGLESKWRKVVLDISPNIVHIHGTEFAHGLALMNALPNLNYLVSIQGLVSVYCNYFLGGIPLIDVLRTATLRDWVRGDTLIHGKIRYSKRGKNEIKYIAKTQSVMGRTDWDNAHTNAINNSVNYYFGNETLRKEFYIQKEWNSENLNTHTIFLSQASNPIKGLQQVIKAIALLKNEFPNITVRIAGGNILDRSSKRKRLIFTGFANYIFNLATKLEVIDNLKFVGSLTAEEMCQEYLNSSLFICPSSIENSPNSVGEAQILGVPVVASYVGGMQNLISHGDTGLLYRFEDTEMLSFYISNVLKNKDLAEKLSRLGMKEAKKRHDGTVNVNALSNVYNAIHQKNA